MYHLTVLSMLEKLFSYNFYHFYKEKFPFYCCFNPKSIKFCQGPLGLGPAGPCDNQTLPLNLYITNWEKKITYFFCALNMRKKELWMSKESLATRA